MHDRRSWVLIAHIENDNHYYSRFLSSEHLIHLLVLFLHSPVSVRSLVIKPVDNLVVLVQLRVEVLRESLESREPK